jgi:hypothetical protein
MLIIMIILIVIATTHKSEKYILINNSIQFFIIYVPSQQPQGQLQTEHSVDTGKSIITT